MDDKVFAHLLVSLVAEWMRSKKIDSPVEINLKLHPNLNLYHHFLSTSGDENFELQITIDNEEDGDENESSTPESEERDSSINGGKADDIRG